MNNSENSSKKAQILAMIEQGEVSNGVIANKLECSERWVEKVRRTLSEQKGENLLPVTLQADIAMGEHLAEQLSALVSNEEEKVGFAKGVKAMLAMQAYDTRLLGQLMTIPVQSQKGQLEEIFSLAKAMQPKEQKQDPAFIASVNSLGQAVAKMAAPKTPQGMLMEAMMPMITNVLASLPGMGGIVPQPQPQPQPKQSQATKEEVGEAFGD